MQQPMAGMMPQMWPGAMPQGWQPHMQGDPREFENPNSPHTPTWGDDDELAETVPPPPWGLECQQGEGTARRRTTSVIPDVCLCVLHGCANARMLSFRNSQDGRCSLSYSVVWAIRHFRIHLHAWLCAIRASCDHLSGVRRHSKAVNLGGVYGRW